MPEKVSNYDIADFLKSKGFGTTSEPFETALRGNIVLILAATASAADMYQRSCYQRLGNTKIDFTAKKWRFRFKNGGRLEIYTPEVDLSSFTGLDREKTFYTLYR